MLREFRGKNVAKRSKDRYEIATNVFVALNCYIYFILAGQEKTKKKIATNRIVAKPWLAHRKKNLINPILHVRQW